MSANQSVEFSIANSDRLRSVNAGAPGGNMEKSFCTVERLRHPRAAANPILGDGALPLPRLGTESGTGSGPPARARRHVLGLSPTILRNSLLK